MAIIVQKFGGTSVATAAARDQVTAHVARARSSGLAVALVVSAMGRRGDPYATDTLLDLLRCSGGEIDPRDYNTVFVTGEMISVAVMSQTLRRAGIPAVPLTGAQARIHAQGHPLEADVVEIDAARLHAHLQAGEVPVVTGGQAVFKDSLDFATLGRGASDTSGVLLGVALGAERVEIFTDVPGVASADPRLVPAPRWLPRASYGGMHELARFGAKVVHPRAIAAGWTGGMPIAVRSTFTMDAGTIIDARADAPTVLGLAALSPMETVLVRWSGAGEERRRDWERQHLVMSLCGESPDTLVLGAPAERKTVLDAVIRDAGLDTLTRVSDTAWLSVVGDAGFLGARHRRDLALLSHLGVPVHFVEMAGPRTTIVLPADTLRCAAAALHQDLFGVEV